MIRYCTETPSNFQLNMPLEEFDARLALLGAIRIRVYKPTGETTFALKEESDFARVWDFLQSLHPEFRCYSYSNARQIRS